MPSSEHDSSVNGRITNVAPDLPDARDWKYRSALVNLKRFVDPPRNLTILDQRAEGACTGFGLAAVINYLSQQRGEGERTVSARMLYEMAKRHDEWDGEQYSGSSCRGAIKGWYNMGVCADELWKYQSNRPGHLSVDAAKDARNCTIGAYYRLAHRISDYHSAINEAGVIYCSATVHEGWDADQLVDDEIPARDEARGGHAFAIVGYNERGFWVQNSWGKQWGANGLAIWTYEDWQRNIQDGWVLRLALPTPQIWHAPTRQDHSLTEQMTKRPAPNRGEIAGHFAHIDDGDFADRGKYWSNLNDVRETTNLLAASDDYDHYVLYAHGGLNDTDQSARRIRAMKAVFKDNRIYPYHFMWDTGLMEELKDVILRRGSAVSERAGAISDASDLLLEQLTRLPGRALWREIKSGARSAFTANGAGTKVITAFVDALIENNARRAEAGSKPIRLHLVGHSAGSILLGYLLNRIANHSDANNLRLASTSLMAPAASVAFYKKSMDPLLTSNQNRFGIDRMVVYNLSGSQEKDDHVALVYRKSLLYLVSRAFEEKRATPIVGMKLHSKELAERERRELVYADEGGGEPRSFSTSHGGFDNDTRTMNDVLRSILGAAPTRPFTAADLDF